MGQIKLFIELQVQVQIQFIQIMLIAGEHLFRCSSIQYKNKEHSIFSF